MRRQIVITMYNMFVSRVVLTLEFVWTVFYGVSIQMKPVQQYFQYYLFSMKL